MPLRPRSTPLTGRGRSGGMDLGTRALVLGVGSLALSWIPVLNIVAFLAALMAVGFGLLARWPTGWIADEEPNTRRALRSEERRVAKERSTRSGAAASKGKGTR